MTTEDDAKLAMLRETLQQNVGLSKYEADVYLALIRGGTQTMTDLAETSDVPKQRVYDTISSLRESGFVEVIDDYPRKAYAVDPTEALVSVQSQIERAEDYLEELHDTVETVESGVALFKSEATIKKYVRDMIATAEQDLLMLVPYDRLDEVTEVLDGNEDVRTRIILSDLPSDRLTDGGFSIDRSVPDAIDDLRGITSTEDFALVADRDRALYWSRQTLNHADAEEQGYYVTNPRLALVLDRFVSESVWPLARPLRGRSLRPKLPTNYLRIRDCLSDISTLTDSQPLTAFEIEFTGYDTDTGEEVTRSGTLTNFYFTEYDVRTSLTVDLHADAEDVESSLVTVGGTGTRDVDYAAQRITLRERDDGNGDRFDDETEGHLSTCRSQLPHEFGDASIVAAFDAFIDQMRELVENRSGTEYDRVSQFESFRESLVGFEASEVAPRVQWRKTRTQPGGHVAHVGNVFDRLGYDVTLVGRLGDPIRSEFIRDFRDQTLVTVGETTCTDYVRFENRNLLFTEPNFEPLDWETIRERVDLSELADYVDGTSIVTIGTWWATPELPDILSGMASDLWPRLSSPPDYVHVSPAEVHDYTTEEIRRGCDALSELNERVPVVVTANRQQTRQFREALAVSDDGSRPTVEGIRDRLGVSRYVMHSLDGATLTTPDEFFTVNAPRVSNPRRVRNVDDHFKSGYALGLAEGCSDGAALVLGNAVAGYFVRHDKSPNAEELRSFIGDYDVYFS